MLPDMKLPSLQRLTEEAILTARRFPLAIACGAIAAVAGALLVDAGDQEELYLRILYAASLGIPLFVALELLAERNGWTGIAKYGPMAAGAALLLLIYALRPGWSGDVALSRYFQLWLGLHLFVAVAPYLGVDERNGFWQYNMSLFLRFLQAALFAAVLFFGISIALLAIENLFGLDVAEEWYGRLWFAIAFLFHPWFFLSGVPESFSALEQRTVYPSGLKVFAQYILAPIVTLYLLILTAYLAKVLLTQEWPSGWIGWLVSSVAAAGILSLLLLQPIEEHEENRWVRTYARWFYVALLPSIAMLLMAIWKRIDQYGVTERRYFLVGLSLWLAGMALYYIFRRHGSIKLIPASLAILTFLTVAGPWGAYAVSERSQTNRLKGILQANGMLRSGQLVSPTDRVSFEDRREISAIVRYLAGTHGIGSIEPWFGEGFPAVVVDAIGDDPVERGDIESRAEEIVKAMGTGYVNQWASAPGTDFRLRADLGTTPIPLKGYEHVVMHWTARSDSISIEQQTYRLDWDEEELTLSLRDEGGDLVQLSIRPAIEAALQFRADSSGTGTIPSRVMSVESRGDRARMAAWFRMIAGSREGDELAGSKPEVSSFDAALFLTVMPEGRDSTGPATSDEAGRSDR
jgi:hypothetical protein